ncbi:MAG TPA: DPP IV N-terminal domain-containing protein [Gemmatimonadales bacterium]|nr:DPP IV N-terminal domain-containing protein [Gemmatimonadales bacterium]
MRLSVAAINTLLLTLGVVACNDSHGPKEDPGPGRLIFTRAGNGLVDIYAVDIRHTNLDQLTTSFAIDERGAWSPDTLKIAFESDRIPDASYTARFQIYVMNFDGSDVSQLTFPNPALDSTGHVKDTTSNFHPAWSPDGTKIAFGSTRDTNPQIYVMDRNGANVVRLTHDSAQDAQPAWSPDGTKIAFATDRDGNAEIYVMNADGSNPVNLTNNPGRDLAPVWSPDGSKIAFQSDRSTDFAVWVMNADGSNPVRLTTPSPPSGSPSWSPDGTRLAYEQNGDIWVINTDGSNKIQVTSGFWADGLPRWRPIP